MGRFTLITLLLLLVSVPGRAQGIEEADVERIPGKWALQFEMPDLLSIDEFLGGTVSMLRIVSQRAAVRLGLEVVYDNAVLESDRERVDWDEPHVKRVADKQAAVLQVHYLVLRPVYGRSRLYFGGGPRLAIGRQFTEEKQVPIDDWEETETTWSLGGQGIIGVAVAIRPRMDLFAEYSSHFGYGNSVSVRKHYDIEGIVYRTITDTQTSWELKPGGALLGVSLYFK